jgi:hypothetical protein
MNDVVWWCTEKLCDDRKLIDVIFSWKQWLPFQHFCEDAPCTPDIDLNIILLPGEHDFWRSVVSRRDIAGHLWVLNTGQAKIADLQVTILIYEDVAGLEIAMYNTCGMDIFQTSLLYNQLHASLPTEYSEYYQDLIQKVLYELFLERSGCE